VSARALERILTQSELNPPVTIIHDAIAITSFVLCAKHRASDGTDDQLGRWRHKGKTEACLLHPDWRLIMQQVSYSGVTALISGMARSLISAAACNHADAMTF
jgi:hypothetical protein